MKSGYWIRVCFSFVPALQRQQSWARYSVFQLLLFVLPSTLFHKDGCTESEIPFVFFTEISQVANVPGQVTLAYFFLSVLSSQESLPITKANVKAAV